MMKHSLKIHKTMGKAPLKYWCDNWAVVTHNCAVVTHNWAVVSHNWAVVTQMEEDLRQERRHV